MFLNGSGFSPMLGATLEVMGMRLRAYVKDIYTRGGQVARESTMALTGISEAGSGDLVCNGKSVVFNKHAKQAGVSAGDSIEFEANDLSMMARPSSPHLVTFAASATTDGALLDLQTEACQMP
jgi:hypothetical protein